MDAAHYGVVIGPASALTDVPTGSTKDALTRRNDVLSSGRVRAIVRLPAGLLTTQPRRRLGLWILGPEQVGVEKQLWSCAVADLTNNQLDDHTVDTLVTDLVAHLHGLGHHYPHFVRSMSTVSLRARRTLFPPLVSSPLSIESAAEIVLRAQAAVDKLATPTESMTAPNVSVRETPLRPANPTVLGVAVSNRDVRVVPGHRIPDNHLTHQRGTKVFGVAELTGEYPIGHRRIDRLVFARYPSGRYTEPGDVVFCQSPRPVALVDHDGGSVVVYPARIARSCNAVFVPAVLAADINRQAPGAKAWKAWTVRRVPPDQTEPLTTVLADISHERDLLIERLSHLDRAAQELTTAVVSGEAVINLNPKDR